MHMPQWDKDNNDEFSVYNYCKGQFCDGTISQKMPQEVCGLNTMQL